MDKQYLGNAIKQQRKCKGLKQTDVAEKTGISRNYISDIENGRYMPSVETLSKLAICLEIDLNAVLVSEIQDISSLDIFPRLQLDNTRCETK